MTIASPDELSGCIGHIKTAKKELIEFKLQKGVVSKRLEKINKKICFLRKYVPLIGDIVISWFLIEKKNSLKEKLAELDDFQEKVQDKILTYQKVIDFFKSDQIASGEVKKLQILLIQNLNTTTNILDSSTVKKSTIQKIQSAISSIEKDMHCFAVDLKGFCSV